MRTPTKGEREVKSKRKKGKRRKNRTGERGFLTHCHCQK
jgi:hypothetical protein